MRITARQEEILNVIRVHFREHGTAPTLHEIGAATGIRSTNAVNDHLAALERKGLIKREAMKSRGIRLVSNGYCPHCGALKAVPNAG